MTEDATVGSLSELVGRLTDPQDRETYASLISYFHSLPPNDELFQLAQLLGLLSLVGQRVPDAVSELLAELREQTQAAAKYHSQVDQHLLLLPGKIAAGVNLESIARSMIESFRQQLTATGLKETATFLNASAIEMRAVSGQISAAARISALEYKDISSTISAELVKLKTASRQLETNNLKLIEAERSKKWILQGLVALVLFLAGGLCGVLLEWRQTTEVVSRVAAEVQRIQTLSVSSSARDWTSGNYYPKIPKTAKLNTK